MRFGCRSRSGSPRPSSDAGVGGRPGHIMQRRIDSIRLAHYSALVQKEIEVAKFRLDRLIRTYVLLSLCPSPPTATASSKPASRSCSARAMSGQGCATSSPRRRPRRARSPTTSARRRNSRARCSTSISTDLKRLVAEALDDANRRPRERLRRYLDIITDRLADAEFSRGCLIGDFSLEAAPQSEMLRTRLARDLRRMARAFRRMHRRRAGGGRDRRDLRA